MNLYNANLFAFSAKEVNNFFNGFGYGTHSYDNILSLGITIIVKGLVITAGKLGNLLHVIGNNIGNRIIEGVASFSCLEENVRILSCTSCYRMLRAQRTAAEILNGFPVNQLGQIVIFQHVNFLNFRGGSETVEEMQERHTTLNSRKMGYTGNIHYFLNAARCQ